MKKLWNKYRLAVAIAMSITVSACIYVYKEYTRNLPDTNKLKSAYTLNAIDFLRQFQVDEAKATAKYSGQVISVQGIVDFVHVTDSNGTVFLNEGNSLASVMCQFDKKDFQQKPGVQKGESITIKGICSGYLMDVIMVRCIIE